MKTILFSAVLIFILSCKSDQDKASHNSSVFTDSLKDSVQTKSTVDPIDEIKKEYNRLQTQLKAKKLNTTGFTYNCNDEITGKVTFYSDNQSIRIIEHSYDEQSHFGSTEQYFIKDGNVFFIFKEDTGWNFDGGTPEKPITKDDITESRVYIQNNKPIKCLEKKYSIRSNETDKPSPDKIPSKETRCNIDELMTTYKSLLKNKDKKGEVKCL
ncbi:hypothetical protein [Chryseobacterium vrystaatense]|uniref:Lipoprotein n=1 Tax=Chryseobacterium vrystaatense TaxID=307480 RepID=A0A1M5D468_9FLAO|nr:hypothetical protein [Chryseobacterium vrystaatense]KFF23495.1 hypothetical protein IW16_24880 [Chryseobacterium vrystaatense]SHF61741.1 hypothetical protein SAMN02787073_2471 [Chryseobacterium vrystaatense]